MNTPVNFEIAKLLKKKGFDIGFGNGQKFYFPDTKELTENYRGNNYPAPTIAEVVMWLYEKHGIWISVLQMLNNGERVTWYASYYEQGVGEDIEIYYNSPTDAYQAAIEYTLNNLI